MPLPSSFQQMIAKTTASLPGVAVNQRRVAVIAHDGLSVADLWAQARPTVFLGSLAGLLGSLAMFWARRRRGGEAWATWGTAAAVSGGLAWVSRPGTAPVDPSTGKPVASDRKTLAQVTEWLDRRATTLDTAEPGWQERTIQRVLG